ncbi:MAG: RdgB/HAM1 family non-canonical purine NTP pyrophosphatase [Pseudomonadales bacterium]|nr:RdgB/HAM1 family non-canonical purine NTP pyrophosphatase [Candidatus Woesebacteria bacterium]MCB9802247.1 RdgB/HAM1 family non-canonical purine NTP pyrophosphatase [Pseudomonadales bacterium]
MLFATNNHHKLEEARSILAAVGVDVLSLSDLEETKHISDIPETGSTFEGNAQQKLDFVWQQYAKLPVMADDSGLEVTALDNQPGVRSKRWVAGSDNDRVAYLLQKIEGNSDRTAQFVTSLCYRESEEQSVLFFTGVVKGIIAEKPRGKNGFGYDPVFIPHGYNNTFAELSQSSKNTLSHRALAFHALVKHLTKEV